jgi:hypothetical protein
MKYELAAIACALLAIAINDGTKGLETSRSVNTLIALIWAALVTIATVFVFKGVAA